MRTAYLFLSLFVLCFGCKNQIENGTLKPKSVYIPTYATGFKILYFDSCKIIQTFHLGDTQSIQINFSKNQPPILRSSLQIFSTDKIIAFSTSQIAAFSLLGAGATKHLVGIANADLATDSSLISNLKKSILIDIGKDFSPNFEKIASLKPSFILTDSEYGSASPVNQKMKNLQIPFINCLDYFEQTPLGRAEWLIFFAALINQETIAQTIFQHTESNYVEIKSNLKTTESPTVFCNLPYQDIWYMPCKGNYVTHFLQDAGADFIWKNDTPQNGLNLSLSYEQVLMKAKSAAFWIYPGQAQTLMDIANQQQNLIYFDAFKNKQVYNTLVLKNGAMPIWGKGIYEPDIVLQDLIHIFHPEKNSYTFRYFKKLPLE